MTRRLNLTLFHRLQFSDTDSYTLFTKGNLRPVQRWTDKMSQYSLWLLERPPFSFPLLPTPHNPVQQFQKYGMSPFCVPSREDWTNMWTVWDFTTRQMITPSMLFEKPIYLRHICLFYLGHIPTFLDIHLSNLLQEPNTAPTEFMVGCILPLEI